MPHRFAALAVALLAALSVAAAPEKLQPDALAGAGRDAVRGPARQLLRARDLADRGKDAEALDSLLRLVESSGDQLVPAFLATRPLKEVTALLAAEGEAAAFVPPDERHLVPARWLCRRLALALSPKALADHRERSDDPARSSLEDAVRRRDPALLRRVVEEWPVATAADTALVLLGDLALADGEPALAAHWWRLAMPAKADVPAVLARLILARIRLGELDDARTELAAFKTDHRDAAGRLAGRDGKFADILAAILDSAKPPAPDPSPWTTFGGDPSRGHVVAGRLPMYWPATPDFTAPLPGETPRKAGRPADDPPPAPASLAARRLAFHPVVWRDYLLVADAVQVRAIDRKTGKSWAVYDMAPPPADIDRRLPARSDARTTLTVADDRVYVRLGAQALKSGGPRGSLDTVIVCLGPPARPRPDGPPLEAYWELTPDRKEEKNPSAFEGTPVVRDDRLYVAVTRFDNRGTVTSVACYGPLTGREPPDPLWREPTEVSVGTGDVPTRHDLLTLAGPNVVHVSNGGGIVAVDARSGKRVWAHLYPRRPPAADGPPRDLNPAVYAAGRVFVAPADANRILVLDAWTGALAWEATGVEPIHLLGVSRGRLVAALAAFPAGIRAWDAASGRVKWTQPDGADGVPTFGRGFVTPEHVFWPTGRGLFVLSVEDGSVVQRIGGPDRWGNLLFADGTLAAAGEREVIWFNAESASLGERRSAVLANPNDSRARYRMALAEADAGDSDAALADFAGVTGHDTLDGMLLRELATRRRWELLRDRGDRAAAGNDFPPALRAAALVGSADGSRMVLATPALHEAWLVGPDGLPRTAGSLARTMLKLPPDARAVDVSSARERLRQTPPGERGSAWADLARLLEKADRRPAARSAWRKAGRAGFDRADANAERLRPPVRPPGAGFPDLRGELRKADEVPLDPFTEWPLDAVPGEDMPAADVFLFGKGTDLVARRGNTGAIAWTIRLPFAPAWYAPHAELFVVAGPGGAAAVDAATGKTAWVFVPPDPTLRFRPLTPTAPPPFLRFALVDGRLFLADGRELVAIDAETGECLWQRVGSPLAVPLAGWLVNPEFLATPDFVLIQTAPGRWLVLDAFTGETRHSGETAAVAWPAPVPTPDALRAVTSQPDAVMLLDLATGRPVWRHILDRWSGLLHEPPQVALAGEAVYVLVGRNHGYELDALDATTGRRKWADSVFVSRSRLDLSAAALGPTTLVLPTATGLLGLRTADGRRAWTRPLPAGGWRATPTRLYESVLVTQIEPTPVRDLTAMGRWAQAQLRAVPTPSRLDRVIGGVLDAWLDRKAGWWLIDPKDGEVLARQEAAVRGLRADIGAVDGQVRLAKPAGLVIWRR